MTEYVDYKTAPIGTVAADKYTTLVKNDKGWYYLEGRDQEDDAHQFPRQEIHRFELGEVITPRTLAWLPPGSEIAPENQRQRYAMTRDTEGWIWSDGTSGRRSTVHVTEWVASDKYTLTKFPGLEENPYVVGKALEGEAAYEGAPVGTLVALEGLGVTIERFKSTNGGWRRLDDPLTPTGPNNLESRRTITGFLAPWEVELLTTPPEVNPRQTGTVSLDYTYNAEKGTVYTADPHRDFGHVVKLPSGRYMAVPVRAVRYFATEQEAVEWLI